MEGHIKVSSGRKGPRSKGKWGMDMNQVYFSVLVIWHILPSSQPSKQDPTCFTSRRQRMDEDKGSFHHPALLNRSKKKKNPQTSANVTHKLQGQGQTSESYGVLHRICAGKRGDRSTSAWRMGNCKTDGASISTTDF